MPSVFAFCSFSFLSIFISVSSVSLLTQTAVPGAGLSIEQRKRVTLGVELVAKPTLLFLDEPTSGLDGQSAYNIVRFLRKLVDGGQAVLVGDPQTIFNSSLTIQSVPFTNPLLFSSMHSTAFCYWQRVVK